MLKVQAIHQDNKVFSSKDKNIYHRSNRAHKQKEKHRSEVEHNSDNDTWTISDCSSSKKESEEKCTQRELS